MPYTVNGIGTAIVPGRGYVYWGPEEDCDALECVVLFYLPLFPFKALHTFEWNNNAYQAHPISWSLGLVFKAFAWRYLKALYLAATMGIFFGAVGTYGEFERGRASFSPMTEGVEILVYGLAGAVLAYGVRRFLLHLDRRDQDIRYVLGPHHHGSSDPGTWTANMAAGLTSPQDLHGTARYVDAVDGLLAEGCYSGAMWAARMEVARGDATQGERATDRVLGHPKVREALPQVREDPNLWSQILADPAPPAEEPVEGDPEGWEESEPASEAVP
jgi:hypothetical protein